MHDQKTQQQYIELRVRGRSYARIAEELQVGRRTLIDWGRKFQFEIHNARVVEMEALRERFLVSREEQVRRLGERLAPVEAELAGRGVAELATPRWCGGRPGKARIKSGSTPSWMRRWSKSMAPALTRQNCTDPPRLRGAEMVRKWCSFPCGDRLRSRRRSCSASYGWPRPGNRSFAISSSSRIGG